MAAAHHHGRGSIGALVHHRHACFGAKAAKPDLTRLATELLTFKIYPEGCGACLLLLAFVRRDGQDAVRFDMRLASASQKLVKNEAEPSGPPAQELPLGLQDNAALVVVALLRCHLLPPDQSST